MRFLMLIYPDIPPTSDEWMPSADTPGAAMGRYNKELSEAGGPLALHGLLTPGRGARIHLNGPLPPVKGGAVTQADESVGGCWVIEHASQDEAGGGGHVSRRRRHPS